jgi:hypothetical protein
MKGKRIHHILTFVFSVVIVSSLMIPVYSEVMINEQSEGSQIENQNSNVLQSSSPFSLAKDEFSFDLPEFQHISSPESKLVDSYISSRKPQARTLNVRLVDSDVGTIKSISDPLEGDKFLRGATIGVDGKLGSTVGDAWAGETVYLYYNITQATYEGNKPFYDGNPDYEVGSAVTNSEGLFTINLDTSDLDIDPFSKVGDITLLTWYRGGTRPEWEEGSPGNVTVGIYGQLEFDIDVVVSNPNNPYSFTTQILYDNGSVVNAVSGTTLAYTVDWTTYNPSDDSGSSAFVASQHIYSNTAPGPGTDTVSYTADYDITQLPFGFFVKTGSVTLDPSEHLILTVGGATEESALVDAYYDTGSGLSKLPQEIEIGDAFYIYANLSSSGPLFGGDTITVTYYYEGSNHTDPGTYTTNSSNEVYIRVYLNPAVNVSDVTQGLIIYLEPIGSDFPGARLIGDSLDTILTVNITTVRIAIDNPSNNFYTVGLPIDFTVEVEDANSNLCPFARFQIDFTGEPPDFYFTVASGDRDVTSLVPSYAVQAQTESIIVTGLDYDGGSYKYYAPASPTDSDTFEMYYTLTLTLTDNDGGNVLDGTSTDVWNRTFWNDFETNNDYYELSAVDQWARNPIGASISITFAGQVASFTITIGQNWVRFDETHLGAGWNHNFAYTGDLIATGGAYAPAPSITQTINIYGPDTEAPVLVSLNFTPDPNSTATHDPYFDITFTVVATDAHSGVRSVTVVYDLYDASLTQMSTDNLLPLINIAPDTYEDTLSLLPAQNQWYVVYAVVVKDYAGQGIDEFGALQANPAYWYTDPSFGYTDFESGYYRVGDVFAPIVEAPSMELFSGNIPNPYIDIYVYINDSIVYSGIWGVGIYVNRTNLITSEVEVDYIVDLMTFTSGLEWTYHIDLEYNYEYTWYYGAADLATPTANVAFFNRDNPPTLVITDDSDEPVITGVVVNAINGTADPDSVLTFNATVTDALTNVSLVTLTISITLGATVVTQDFEVEMIRIGTTDVYTATVDLSQFRFRETGTYDLVYDIEATDGVDNTELVSQSLTVDYVSGGLGISNLGAIIGGAAGALVVILGGLFLWFNRHTIQTYAKRQTFRRRLRDYLREIIDDIKKDGLEGRYKQGLLKTWSVVEGIGREFFDLPRYRSQTPTEFARLLSYKGKIERELMSTLLEYFEKARYSMEEITEKDFNAGVRALLKIVDKIEVGEMKIES